MTAVNKYLCALIKGCNCDHLIVRLRDTDKIRSVVKNFNFIKYDFSFSNITDDIVKSCLVLYSQSWLLSSITDESVLTTFGISSEFNHLRNLTTFGI